MNRTRVVPSLWGNITVLAGFLVVCAVAAGIGGLATAHSVGGWYQTLTKPAFSPPAWLFGPVWTALYALMAVSAFWTWRQGWPSHPAKRALAWFGIQLALNVLWSGLFFGLQAPGAALVEWVLLWGAIVAWMLATWRVSRGASLILLPYLAWVTFAGVLNAALWQLN